MSRMTRILLLAFWLPAAAIAACGGGSSVDTIENDGRVCLFNPSGAPSDGLEAGEVVARVDFNACLSGTCDEVRSKTCTATLDGTTVSVDSKASIQRDTGECSEDCGLVGANCDVGELDAGSYTLEHGEETFEFTVPSDDAVCGGESPAPMQ